MPVPPKLLKRFKSGLKRLRPILRQQRQRDVSEADTVTLVKDFLSQVLGYDKYRDLSGEYAVKGQFCDLAIRAGESVSHFVEVKAIGISLADKHLLQALHYAASEGVEWVILTNGIAWQLYSVIFGKPIGTRLVAEFDVLEADLDDVSLIEAVHAMTKEGAKRGVHLARKAQLEALDRHVLAALLLKNRRVVTALCNELCRIVKVKVDARDLPRVLQAEVIKRDVLESPAYQEALQRTGVRSIESVPEAPRVVNRAATRHEGSLADLIKAGAVNAPMRLFREYRGRTLEATLHPDGTIEVAGKRYDSPSEAGSAARQAVTGRPMATNGWVFWQYAGHAGTPRPLAALRRSGRSRAARGA